MWNQLIQFASQIIQGLYSFTHSYGLAIILLTIGIRILIMPVYQRQMTSMRAMAQLQPKIKELQQRYKGDPQRLNQAQMDLYREYKVNPLAGCLPTLIQLPFLYIIYDALVQFKYVGSSAFLWIPSMSLAGSHYALGFVLPLLAAATTFWQTRISTPQQSTDKSQQILMSVLLPVFIGYMAWQFPAGLSLYWVVSNLFAIAQQYALVGSVSGPPAKAEAKP